MDRITEDLRILRLLDEFARHFLTAMIFGKPIKGPLIRCQQQSPLDLRLAQSVNKVANKSLDVKI